MAELLLGKEVNNVLHAGLAARVEKLAKKQVVPQLAIVRVGENEADLSYERGARTRCEKLGIKVCGYVLPENCTEKDLLEVIYKVNADRTIHGVLMFRPLPKGIDEEAVIRALDPAKDMDGITPGSIAGVFAGKNQGYPPCTAQAVMEILHHYGIDPTGKRVVVIGRSMVIGRPVAMMLLQENATVTICHTRTKDLPAVAKEADILVAAVGRAGMVGADFVRPGQVVIDVGINVNAEGKLCGDVDFEAAEPVVEKITPVPRGVGSVTTSVLASHVIAAAEKAAADR
jgi:methylenetetrahydrofolate dehydrogenase (NADP+)/methenyltetrahydrofolate cyclohydrolase